MHFVMRKQDINEGKYLISILIPLSILSEPHKLDHSSSLTATAEDRLTLTIANRRIGHA
jgi:hypothetical protein